MNEITRQVAEAASATRMAVTRTEATDAMVRSLSEAASKIGEGERRDQPQQAAADIAGDQSGDAVVQQH